MKAKRKVFSKEVRNRVKAKFGGRCAYCGCELGDRFALDHHISLNMGGRDDEENLFPSCIQCNHYKGGGSLDAMRKMISHTYVNLQNSLTGKMAAKYGMLIPNDGIVFYFERFKN